MQPSVTQPNPPAAKKQRMDFVPAGNARPAVPVTSAKAAINAMYAERAQLAAASAAAPSARDAVNAAASERERSSKSAAHLHHGSIPRSMESTRTSASALIRTAGQSADQAAPVVRTSLKLGAAARPKEAPVVLPPNARMARAARSVDQIKASAKLAVGRNSHQNKLVDAELVEPTALTVKRPKALTSQSRAGSSENALAVKVVPSGKARAARRPAASGVSDPSMRRFRSAPKGYAATRPSVKRPKAAVDNGYALIAPPKLREHHATPEIRAHRPSRVPEPLGDSAPIGRVSESHVAFGHGDAAKPYEPTIKAENTSSYSFSRKDRPESPKPAPYTPGGQSPFLKSVSVEKRPLSGGVALPAPVSSSAAPSKPAKASRKNQYAKKESREDLPTRPTVIIPSSRRSKVPLFFLILLTILLGAVVGAAVYLCFFQ